VDSSHDAAFEDFVQGYAAPLTALSYALCGDWGQAQDACQTALERVYVRWATVRDPHAFARRLVVNSTRDGWRRFGRRVQVGLPARPEPGWEPTAAVEDRDEMVRALQHLLHGQRSIVVLRFWQDLTEAQTAAALGITVGTVKSQTSRALTRLRQVLAQPEFQDTHPDQEMVK